MPELPEVELARRDLHRWTVTGEALSFIDVDAKTVRGKLSTNPNDALSNGVVRLSEDVSGCCAVNVLRAGKRLGWQFDGPISLLVHLGMSGKWVDRDTSALTHVRARAVVGDTTLSFIDPRRFGCLVPVPTAALEEWLTRGLGPDALEQPMDGPLLAQVCNSRGAIKTVLLDQKRLAGVGNIQAAEALWRAGVRPDRPANSLTSSEWDALAIAIPEQLRWTLDVEKDGEVVYLSEWGSRNPFAVYGREEQSCPRCTAPIARAVHSGRSSFWCPDCQG
ncbi:MAG: formamidopyrimidine-DNA glycosylase [Myxococcota bacterium]